MITEHPLAKDLVKLLMLREKRFEEQRKLAEEKTKYHNDNIRNNSHMFNWFFRETQAHNRQQKCSHLKGQIGYQIRGGARDYNVAMHTFPTGETKIWCLSNCGWNVWNRPGWSFKWAIGMRMVESSTNHASKSQVMYVQRPKAMDPDRTYDAVYFDNSKAGDIGDENPIRGLKENR